MDMRTMPPIINSASNASVTGSAPQLDAMVPGTTGGMPAVGGLSVTQNPMAKQLQSYGRGDDKMLVHMTPGEVGGLQQLAMAHGGSLGINPHTGLPEAGFLSKLLPTLIGFGLAATGIGAPLAAGMVGLGQTALTGSLSKGLMAGLGAFGGAGLAGAVGAGGAISHNALGLLGKDAGVFGANMGLGTAQLAPVAVTPDSLGNLANTSATQMAGPLNIPASGIAGGPGATTLGAPTAAVSPMQAAINSPEFAKQFASSVGNMPAPMVKGAEFTGGLGSRFGQATKQGLGGAPKILAKNAPMLAGMGVLQGVSGAMQPGMPTYDEEEEYKSNYKGPYVQGKRELSFQSPAQMQASGGAEHKYFTPSNPPPRPVSELTPEERAQYGFAEGGLASLPASNDFQSMVNYFNANSPGAITASMRPYYAGQSSLPSSPAPTSPGAGEIMHFNRPSTNPVSIPTPMVGGGQQGGIDGGFGGYDPAIMADVYDRFGRMEARVFNPDYSVFDDRFNQIDSRFNTMQDSVTPALSGINDRFGQLENNFTNQFNQIDSGLNERLGRVESSFTDQFNQIDSGLNDRFSQVDSRFNTLPSTDLSGIYDRFGQIENNFTDQFNQLDSGLNNRLGQVETNFAGQFNNIDSGLNDRFSQIDSRFNTLPTTDLSGVYDRFGQLENRFGEQIGQLDSELDSQLGQINSRFDSIPSTDLSGVYSQLGNLDSRLSNMPATDLSGVYDQLGNLDSRLSNLPTPAATDLSGVYDRFNQIDSRFNSIPATDLSGVYSQLGNLDSRLSNLPTPAATDLSGVYDRFNQIDSRFNSLPTPAATDLSGVYSQLGNLDSRLSNLPTPAATDLSGVYSQLGNLDSRLSNLPTPAATDLSGVYDRFNQIDSRFNSLPTPAATDLSGVYDQLGQINSRFDTLPTPAATDLSGVYSQLGNLDSRLSSLPTPAATDLSGVYDQLGQINSRFDTLPTPAATDLSGVYAQLQQLQQQLAASQQSPTNVSSGMQTYDNFGGFARGGEVDMRNGSFVVDARTVSELGNGSSNAGMELLARMGGRPLHGPGDGVSDSIRARIGGRQEARVARDEVLFSPEAVKRVGGGSDKRGTAKLYSLMDRAHKARKTAKRGQDTKVRKELA